MKHRERIDAFFAAMKDGGGDIDTALVYDIESGWRIAFGSAGEMLVLTSAAARRLAVDCRDRLRRMTPAELAPHQVGSGDTVPIIELFNDIEAMAIEARQKNRSKAVPDGYAEAMPTAGSA